MAYKMTKEEKETNFALPWSKKGSLAPFDSFALKRDVVPACFRGLIFCVHIQAGLEGRE